MNCRYCNKEMPFDTEWHEYDHYYYKQYFCIECDYYVNIYEEDFNIEMMEECDHYHDMESDYFNSVI